MKSIRTRYKVECSPGRDDVNLKVLQLASLTIGEQIEIKIVGCSVSKCGVLLFEFPNKQIVGNVL